MSLIYPVCNVFSLDVNMFIVTHAVDVSSRPGHTAMLVALVNFPAVILLLLSHQVIIYLFHDLQVYLFPNLHLVF